MALTWPRRAQCDDHGPRRFVSTHKDLACEIANTARKNAVMGYISPLRPYQVFEQIRKFCDLRCMNRSFIRISANGCSRTGTCRNLYSILGNEPIETNVARKYTCMLFNDIFMIFKSRKVRQTRAHRGVSSELGKRYFWIE